MKTLISEALVNNRDLRMAMLKAVGGTAQYRLTDCRPLPTAQWRGQRQLER
ncbi:hypothetical protein ACLK17_03070 [Escherichia coli]